MLSYKPIHLHERFTGHFAYCQKRQAILDLVTLVILGSQLDFIGFFFSLSLMRVQDGPCYLNEPPN